MALKQAGKKAKGGVMYVTLEPCCHHQKTPPCVPALVKAGIRRVVYSEPYEHAASSHEEANSITLEFIRESALAVEKYRPEHQAKIAL